jgi:3',5'-cyclic AMP phosphodiesterase CpdA
MIQVSCKEFFDYSPYIVDFSAEDSSVHEKNLELLKKNAADDTITIALTGDTHRDYDEAVLFVEHVNKNPFIDLVIHSGDFADFGLPRQYEWGNGIMRNLQRPYFVTIGNHDLVGNGSLAYERMFGEMNFSFIYNKMKFVFINTNSREYAFNGKVPDIRWIENELFPDGKFDKVAVIFHTPPFDSDFDSSLETEFASVLGRQKNVMFAIHGHIHKHDIRKPYADSIQYINVYGIQDKQYYVIQITEDEFSIETINI